MSVGWIKLHRRVLDHWLFREDREFSRWEAWEYLLLKANFERREFLFGGEKVTCERGQFITSIVKLSEIWGWSRKKTTMFLDLLEEEQMIVTERSNKRTGVTICNYDKYQSDEQQEDTAEEQQKSSKGASEEHKIRINKNNKEIKKEKPAPRELLDQVQLPPAYDNERGRKALGAWLEFKREKGQKYKSAKTLQIAIRHWAKEFPTYPEFEAAVVHSMSANYNGIYPPPKKQSNFTDRENIRTKTIPAAESQVLKALNRSITQSEAQIAKLVSVKGVG